MYLHVINANLHDVFLFNYIIYFISFLCVENKGDIYQMHFLLLLHSIQMDGDTNFQVTQV